MQRPWPPQPAIVANRQRLSRKPGLWQFRDHLAITSRSKQWPVSVCLMCATGRPEPVARHSHGGPAAHTRPPEQGLTPRSTGAPTAYHQRPACGTWCIITVRALAASRRRPVTSNVRQHKSPVAGCPSLAGTLEAAQCLPGEVSLLGESLRDPSPTPSRRMALGRPARKSSSVQACHEDWSSHRTGET